jgi:hypothetical protein
MAAYCGIAFICFVRAMFVYFGGGMVYSIMSVRRNVEIKGPHFSVSDELD